MSRSLAQGLRLPFLDTGTTYRTAWEGVAKAIVALCNNASPRPALEALALQMPQRAAEDAMA